MTENMIPALGHKCFQIPTFLIKKYSYLFTYLQNFAYELLQLDIVFF